MRGSRFQLTFCRYARGVGLATALKFAFSLRSCAIYARRTFRPLMSLRMPALLVLMLIHTAFSEPI